MNCVPRLTKKIETPFWSNGDNKDWIELNNLRNQIKTVMKRLKLKKIVVSSTGRY